MTDDRSAAWRGRYQPWLDYVNEAARAVDTGRGIPLGPGPEPLWRPAPAAGGEGAKVVYCAPHPDDESLSGVLALRLSLEAGARVTNVAITLGSDIAQRARRRRELESACRALGFDLVIPTEPSTASSSAARAESGFERVNAETRETHPAEWSAKVESLSGIFDRQPPDVVFAPHVEDFNTTHIGTYWLVLDALGSHLERGGRGPVTLIQTEFWHPLADPNLMVGVSPETLAAML
ncbi:MAG TPA: PIG-L family deacetylase, partial [Terriglobia bacterium]|nr:PIG-L family deacetylase [Terriglobia bacterium]